MAQYKLELKPIKALGVEKLPQDKLQFFTIMLEALAKLAMMVEGVTNAHVTDEHYLLIEGSDSIEATLKKFHNEAIITKIE